MLAIIRYLNGTFLADLDEHGNVRAASLPLTPRELADDVDTRGEQCFTLQAPWPACKIRVVRRLIA